MSYAQAIKHLHNHRKDKYTQQCGAYIETLHITSYNAPPDRFSSNSKISMQKIIDSVSEFPIYVLQDCHIGIWEIVPSNNLFGSKIENRASLLQFSNDYA